MLEIQNVVKSYGGRRALDGVTLTAGGTGVLGVLGPNGAGKTTLMRVLATVAAVDAGAVRLLGRDPRVPDDRTGIRRRLGYVPLEAGFPRGFTAFEYVDYVAILKEHVDRRARHDEVRRVLAAVELTDLGGRKIRKLSGGMRRRLLIAQALLGHPELLVLDEPTVGLDPEQRLRFRDTVSELAQRCTVVISTHQTEDVSALCSRVVVLHQGRLLADGSPAALAGAADGRVWTGATRHPGARLAWRTAEGTVRQIGDPPPGSVLVPPTLEDGYLLLIGAESATVDGSEGQVAA